MSRRSARRRQGVLYLTAVLLVLGLSALPLRSRTQQTNPFEDSPFLRMDPEKVVISERDWRVPCGECHISEYEVWQDSKHATGFNTMHRTDQAQDILREMGLRTTKRQEAMCLKCHYTVKAPSSSRAIAGVSCESCHGAAHDWVEVHNTWGPGVEHPDDELPEHAEARVAASLEGGMLRPSGDLYAVAANCFECHTVPVEDLVNVGGHNSGSATFELVEWAASVRHNFVEAQWTPGSVNRVPSLERTRMMYVIGRILDYEYSLRGMARATVPARFSKAMERRATRARRALETIAQVTDIPEVNEVLVQSRNARLTPDNQAALLEVVRQIRDLGQSFARTHDGSEFVALDPMDRGRESCAGRQPVVFPCVAQGIVESPQGGEPVAGDAETNEPRTEAEVPPDPVEEAGDRNSGEQVTTAAVVVGRQRDRPAWFPEADSRYRTTLAGCGSCHAQAEEWWFDDPHEASALRLLNKEPRAVDIALSFGLTETSMQRRDQICMNCHGTIPSAAPTTIVQDGVSCESCHGPSSEYLEPHEEGGNPQLGMTALKEPAVRAATCARCHHMTDERLISAGHPTGEGYDFAAANVGIVHFPGRRVERAREGRGEGPYSELDPGVLTAAYAQELAKRPIPDVAVVALRRPPLPLPASRVSPADGVSGTEVVSRRRTAGTEISASPPPQPPLPRPVARTASRPSVPVDLGPLPEVTDATTVEEILVIVKQRLERLYRAVGRSN